MGDRVIQELQKRLPGNYPWPGNFRELEQAVRNCLVRGEYQPARPKADNPTVETIYENSEVSLNEWTQLYVKKAVQNHGSYRAAARRLKADQRTVKKLAEAAPN